MTSPRFSGPVRPIFLFGIYCLARLELLSRLHAPTFGWRPTELAGIAVNYYRNGFHFAYPQIMWGGAGAGHVEMEFPLQPFLTALLFKLFGLHDSLNEVLPFLCGFALVWAVAEFGRYLFGDLAGLAAGVNVALSPTLVYLTTTGMWPDPPMLLCGTLGLYLLTRWSDGGNPKHLVVGTASISLAILLKITGLYLGLPVLWLFVKRYGRDFLKQQTTWLAVAAMLIPPALWYFHAYRLYLEDGNTFGIIGPGYLKFTTVARLGDLYLHKRTAIRIVLDHVTPLGFVAFGYGLYRAFVDKHVLSFVWLGSVVLHILGTWTGSRYSGHLSYLIPILPVSSLLAGLAFQTFVRWLRERAGARWQPRLYAPLLGGLSLLLALNAIAASHHLNRRDLGWETAVWEQKRLTGIEVGRVTRPGSLIIVTDDQMDDVDQAHSMTPPDVFYFGDRRGWYLSLAWLTVEKIEELRAKGAEYFVVSSQSVKRFETGHADIHEYLDQHFRRVTDRDGLIYILTGT